MQRKAYSYVRFSSLEQRKGNSLERQTDASKRLAKKHDWRLDTSLHLADLGRSAFKGGQQTALDGFLKAIEDGRVEPGSVLIVEQLDRLSREDIDVALQLFLRIIQAGVDIATLTPEAIHTRQSIKNIAGLIVPLVLFAEANASSAGKSSRAIDNWKRKRQRKKPLTSLSPAWVRLDGEKFVLIPEKAEIIRQIYRLAIDGFGARVITKRLNEQGIENIAFGTRINSLPTWNQIYVETILRSRAVVGEYQPCRLDGKKRIPQGPPIANYFPAVVDEETYWAAQAAKKSRYKQRGNPGKQVANIFTGILFDARTGSTMRLVSASKTDRAAGTAKRLAAYHATNGAAVFMSWKYHEVEKAFLKFVREIAASDLVPQAKESDRLPGLRGQLAEVERRMTELEAEFADDGDAKLFAKTMRRLAAKKAALEADINAEQIEKAKVQSSAPAELLSVLDLLEKAKGDDLVLLRSKLKAVIRQVVSEVWLLMEKYTLDDGQLRTCTVQVFFANGSHRQFSFGTHKWKPYGEGYSAALPAEPFPLFDLRKWRYHCRPLMPFRSLVEQDPIPTPDGSPPLEFVFKAEKEARPAAVK